MMSLYLILNICIIFVPLLFSFEKKIQFYKQIPRVLISIIVTGSYFICWDIYATSERHWNFNKAYIGTIIFTGLPLEEILFFITVPYAMLFLYQTFLYYSGERINHIINTRTVTVISILLMLVSGYLSLEKGYTTFVLFTSAAVLLLIYIYLPEAHNIRFWLFLLLSYIPFLLVNYILTSVPVVTYNNSDIWGPRFTTIPLEDFFYSFSMISLWILVYTKSKKLSFLSGGKHDQS